MAWLGGVVPGERLYLALSTPAALPGAEAQGAIAGVCGEAGRFVRRRLRQQPTEPVQSSPCYTYVRTSCETLFYVPWLVADPGERTGPGRGLPKEGSLFECAMYTNRFSIQPFSTDVVIPTPADSTLLRLEL